MNPFKKSFTSITAARHHLIIYIEVIILTFLLVSLFFISPGGKFSFPVVNQDGKSSSSEAKKFIKWVDFDVTAKAMQEAFRYDINTCQSELHLNWVDMLAYLGARYGGDFSRYSTKDLDALAEQLLSGKTMEELTEKNEILRVLQRSLWCSA